MRLSHAAGLAARWGLGLVFLYAGCVKLWQPHDLFAATILNYGIVQPAMAEVLARILPPLEVVIGIVLLSGRFRKSISLTAAALLSAFFALMLWAYLRDLKIACGCFAGGEPIGPRTLLRDGVLLAVSLYLAISTWRVPQKPRSGCLP